MGAGRGQPDRRPSTGNVKERSGPLSQSVEKPFGGFGQRSPTAQFRVERALEGWVVSSHLRRDPRLDGARLEDAAQRRRCGLASQNARELLSRVGGGGGGA